MENFESPETNVGSSSGSVSERLLQDTMDDSMAAITQMRGGGTSDFSSVGMGGIDSMSGNGASGFSMEQGGGFVSRDSVPSDSGDWIVPGPDVCFLTGGQLPDCTIEDGLKRTLPGPDIDSDNSSDDVIEGGGEVEIPSTSSGTIDRIICDQSQTEQGEPGFQNGEIPPIGKIDFDRPVDGVIEEGGGGEIPPTSSGTVDGNVYDPSKSPSENPGFQNGEVPPIGKIDLPGVPDDLHVPKKPGAR